MANDRASTSAPLRVDGAAPSEPPNAPSRLSLRLRLTLLTVSVFLVIQGAISVARYLYVDRQLDASLQARLLQQAQSLMKKIEQAGAPPSPGAFYQLVEAEPRSILVEELLVSLYTPAGKLLASNCDPPINFGNALGPAAVMLRAPMHRRYEVKALQTADGQLRPGRTVAVPWTTHDGERQVLVVATSDEFVVQLTREIGRNIWLSIPIGALPVAVSGWLIAGIAVRPIVRLRQVARLLQPDSLDGPIDMGSRASEVRKLQDELNDVRRRLHDGYRAQEQFAANVAHEMKTPLAIVAAHAELVRGPAKDSPELARFVDLAAEECMRLARTCESLLLLARVRHGKPVVTNARPYLVNEWVMDSVQDCAGVARMFDVTVVPRLLDGDDLDATVLGDRDLLRIMLDNVLRNAIRFSPTGGAVRVDVAARSDAVDVVVRDAGPGIPTGMLIEVFERFVQSDADGAQGGRGSGIGLQIAKGIADLHRGSLVAANVPSGGCAMTARLPRQPADAADPEPPLIASPGDAAG